MGADFEQYKLLQVIQRECEIEELVKFHIPYRKILSHLRKVLEAGLITQAPDGKLVLTQAGIDFVTAPAPESSQPPASNDLSSARTEKADLDLVFLPENEVGT